MTEQKIVPYMVMSVCRSTTMVQTEILHGLIDYHEIWYFNSCPGDEYNVCNPLTFPVVPPARQIFLYPMYVNIK